MAAERVTHAFGPGEQGPRRVTCKEIEDAFAQGWAVEIIEPTRFEVRPDLKDFTFSEGGPKALFVVVRRAGRKSWLPASVVRAPVPVRYRLYLVSKNQP